MIAIRNGLIMTPFQKIKNGIILIEDGIIKAVGEKCKIKTPSDTRIINAEGRTLLPGFININEHGNGERETLDDTYESINRVSKIKAKYGTTSLLLTTISAPQDNLLKSGRAVKETIERGTEGANVLGLHLEGPYINAEKKGGHNEKYIREPSLEEFNEVVEASGSNVKIVTLAPEVEGGVEFVKSVCQRGIVASIGHSNATYHEVVKAAEAGISHACHAYNGMRAFHHREPGTIGAVLTIDEITNEIISDGKHVHPAAVKLLVRCKKLDRIILVTAGSVLTMNVAVRNVMDFVGLSLQDAVRMATINPAERVGMSDRKGSLEVGKDADIAIVDDDLNIYMTMIKGRIVYNR